MNFRQCLPSICNGLTQFDDQLWERVTNWLIEQNCHAASYITHRHAAIRAYCCLKTLYIAEVMLLQMRQDTAIIINCE